MSHGCPCTFRAGLIAMISINLCIDLCILWGEKITGTFVLYIKSIFPENYIHFIGSVQMEGQTFSQVLHVCQCVGVCRYGLEGKKTLECVSKEEYIKCLK